MRDDGGDGARIRAVRLRRDISQAALARMAGISPSYLNLIEHGRRAIGGTLLRTIARALDVEPSRLSQGVQSSLIEALSQIGANAPQNADPLPELDRIDAMAANFPGWAGTIQRQAGRIAALERTVQSLGERLSHDPLLSASVHNVLSSVTAIQSTSAILVEDDGIADEWRRRFHRNLFEDSRRLADSARLLARQLEGGDKAERIDTTPQDEVERWLAERNFHIAALEVGTPDETDVPALVQGMSVGPARKLLIDHLHQYVADARALPAAVLSDAVAANGVDPFRIATAIGQDPARVMRRLVTLTDVSPRPGLIRCDGAGSITLRCAVPGFEVPRSGTGCALWPMFESLWFHRPVSRRVKQVGRAARPVLAHAVSRIDHPQGPHGPAILTATMLVVPDDGAQDGDAPYPVGQSCRICPRSDCPARSEPSILPESPQ